MNDVAENHWAYARFIEAVNLELAALSENFIDELDKVLSETQLRILPFTCSFSTDGDVLSQWRAYADDGCGVSIGFDAKSIERLSIRSVEIEYDRKKQVEHFRVFLLAMNEVYLELPIEERKKFIFEIGAAMGVDFCCFKNPAFSEEKEVRIIRAIAVEKVGNYRRLIDEGGTGKDELSQNKLPIKFRSRSGGIVCYVDLPLSGLGNQVLKEVVIGPKSPNTGVEVETLLLNCGFDGFSIRHSSATYR